LVAQDDAAAPRRPGITGAHLLLTDTPQAALTTEQKIRGADAVADWIVLVSGFGRDALLDVFAGELGVNRLAGVGGDAVKHAGPFRLVHAVTPMDFVPAASASVGT
jgi:hypothetical protein